MSEVQALENNSPDPRWSVVRVSRIHLGITLVGVPLALQVIWLISGMPQWIRLSLLLAVALAIAWDLRLILLKGRDSVGAFYLFDLDIDPRPATPSAAGAAPSATDKEGGISPKLGIRLKFANAAKHLLSAERDGTVLTQAYVSPWFTALRYRLPGDAAWRRWWPRVIPLWPDSLDAGEFRRIRVALKWK